MTTLRGVQNTLPRQGAWRILVGRLNSTWHEKALWVYMFIVIGHWLEHLVQGYQVYVLGWTRAASKGLLGLWMPGLVESEALHFGYAVFMLAGLFLLRPGFRGRARIWWDFSLIIQTWHFIEHAILQWQAIAGTYYFGGSVPTSVLQMWIPRVELHLIYNAAVTLPMVVAMFFHRYPPKGEMQHGTQCSCAQ